MKKHLSRIVAVLACACALCGCGGLALPMPAYPLEAAAITEALAEAGLSWEIAEGESWLEDHTVHMLHDGDGRMVAAISSGMQDGQRALHISFMSYNGKVTRPLSEEEWEGVIVLGTILYGGFVDRHRVYNRFADDYAAKNMAQEVREQKPGAFSGYEEILWWERTMNEIRCRAGIGRPHAGMPQSHLFALSFTAAEGAAN